MKVTIGPYVSWFGPYQLAEKLLFWKDKEHDSIYKLGDRLDETPIGTFLTWFHSKQERKVKVHIDAYDVWNMDSTLALVVVPMIEKLKECQHGTPFIDAEDLPKHLAFEPKDYREDLFGYTEEEDNLSDKLREDQWNWILDEMIFAFKSKDDEWEEQFYSGESDLEFKEMENGFSELVSGYGHTLKIDWDGRKAYQERITNGFRLFGKYYEGLWD
jgi:hypothetical protein